MSDSVAATSENESFSGKTLLKNSSLNILGQVVPVLVGLFSIPALIHQLGTERFGVLMLAWMCLGYFNLFDLGLSRALTKSIAERIGTENEHQISKLFWTTVMSTAVLGLAGAAVMALSASVISSRILNVPEGLETETRNALYVISICLPFVITTTSFKGLLEATQSFVTINRIQIPLSLAFYLLPLLFSLWSPALPFIIFALVLSRVAGWIAFFRASYVQLPETKSETRIEPRVLPDLLKFGGWVTVSNILIPIIAYADRFIIGSLLTLSAVTYYSTPYEIVNKMWIFPGAIMSVLFPAFASYLRGRPERAAQTYFSALKLLVGILAPITVMIVLFAYEGLSVWAGPDIATKSSVVMQYLAIAIFINCLGILPTAMLDALGRPAISAISHLIQLPLYIASLYLLVPRFGVVSAAVIWIIRNLVDGAVLFLYTRVYFPLARIDWKGVLGFSLPFFCGLLLVVWFEPSLKARALVGLIFLLSYPPWLWVRFFTREDRTRVLRVVMSAMNSRRGISESKPLRESVGVALAAYKPNFDYFVAQLRSLQSQTLSNWICVISLDSDLDLFDPQLAEFRKDARFIWVRNPTEAGVNTNFEYAISVCIEHKVDTIAFADQDDVWYPNKLERLLTELRRCPPASLVHSDMHIFSDEAELSRKELPTGWDTELRIVEGYVPLQYLVRNTVTGAACLFDVELARIGLPIPKSIRHHDQWFAFLAAIFGDVHPVFEPLYAYRQHGENVVGILPFNGIFTKPENVTWGRGFQNAARGWMKSVELFEHLERSEIASALPPIYRKVLKRPVYGAPFFLLMAFLHAPNDPTLARAFLARGVGAMAFAAGIYRRAD